MTTGPEGSRVDLGPGRLTAGQIRTDFEAITAWLLLRGRAPVQGPNQRSRSNQTLDRADVTAQALIAHCNTQRARYKCPRIIRPVDSLPRTATGKVVRLQLRRQFESETAHDHTP